MEQAERSDGMSDAPQLVERTASPIDTARAITRFEERFFVGDEEGDGVGPLWISVGFTLPPPGLVAQQPVVFFCSPGGSLSKGYFDLDAHGDRVFSFAEAMAAQGWITVAIDHPGVGDSDRPEDGYRLHPDVIAKIDNAAFDQVRRRLLEGIDGYPPLGDFLSVGLGHSMGGMMTGLVQAAFQPYDAVAILGSGPYGFFSQLAEPLKPYAGNPEATRRDLMSVIQSAGIPAYMELSSNPVSKSIFFGGDKRGVEALKATRSQLIVGAGFFTMVPGSWGPDAAKIKVPLLLVYGDQDICREPRAVPPLFSGATDITLLVLEDTGHNHFVFPSCSGLFDRIAAWVRSVLA